MCFAGVSSGRKLIDAGERVEEVPALWNVADDSVPGVETVRYNSRMKPLKSAKPDPVGAER